MSYDTIKSQNARRAYEWLRSDMEDVARGDFLRQLDRAEFEVTDFEARFIENFLTANQLNWWTNRRRATCDQMRKTYGGRL